MLETSPPHSTTDPGPRHRRPSRGLRIGLTLMLVGGLLVALGVRYYVWCEGASGPRTPLAFTVEEGASGEEVVNSLHDRGVLRCATVSRWLLARNGQADEVLAGTYDLTTNMEPSEAFDIITQAPAPAPTVRLTIPEGYRLTQIADRVHEVVGIPVDRFLDATDRGHWSLPPFLPEGKPLEGFLFPQTYEFLAHGTTPGQVIDRLLQEFSREAGPLPWQNAEALGVSPYQVVTIASMIEREARVPEDRPLIAAVIYNRLDRGMSLGIDATVAYIDPDAANGLTVSDFRIRSPYNTRLHPGLPPTPIASPGLASLQAALDPAKVDYLYFVLCGADGHHVFSTSNGQFEKDKARCLG
jgi:peptidoglycan lytic transglycosylase G